MTVTITRRTAAVVLVICAAFGLTIHAHGHNEAILGKAGAPSILGKA